jgi:cysteine synthase A
MFSSREKLFEYLSGLVGNTPLYEIKSIKDNPDFNGCRIFCKEEYKNPTGSHYDRFWVEFFRILENMNHINDNNKNNPIIETSTGNSGASFAWVCRALGYTDYRVVIPKDMPDMRKRQIKSYGAKIRESPEKQYIRGLVEEFKKYCTEVRKKTKRVIIRPNHATNGQRGQVSMEKIAHEIINDLNQLNVHRVDYHISALGNGIATSGVAKVFKEKFNTQIIGIEPEECPTFFYTKKNMERPKSIEYTHKLYGTGSGDSGYEFPILNDCLSDIDVIELVSEDEWRGTMLQLQDLEGKFVGHTSAACFHEACKIAKKEENNNKIIVIIFYDADWKYFKNYHSDENDDCDDTSEV